VPGVTRSDRRYQTKRIPGTQEGKEVAVIGYLRLVALEPDGDYHLQLTESTSSTKCVIAEVPNPDFVTDARLKAQAKAAREAIDKLRKKGTLIGGALLPIAVRVKLSGVLFYDSAHVGTPPRGKQGMTAPSLWELHPVAGVTLVQ
jgi:hypothetical protein